MEQNILETTRICAECKETKDLTLEFSKKKKSRGGFSTRCKKCLADAYALAKESVSIDPSQALTKKCKKCLQEKVVVLAFGVNAGLKDGYSNKCKECAKSYAANRRSDPVFGEAIAKKKKEYRKTSEAKEAARRYTQEYRRTNPLTTEQKDAKKAWNKSEIGKAGKARLKYREVVMDGYRVCTVCVTEKHVTEFNKSHSGLGNRSAKCTLCQAEYHRKHNKTAAGLEAYNRRKLRIDHTKRGHQRHKRRAMEMGAPGAGVTRKDWVAIQVAYGGRCVYCGVSGSSTMDHIEPLIRGGAHEPENLAVSCKSCNSAKHASFLLEWALRDTERFLLHTTKIVGTVN